MAEFYLAKLAPSTVDPVNHVILHRDLWFTLPASIELYAERDIETLEHATNIATAQKSPIPIIYDFSIFLELLIRRQTQLTWNRTQALP